MRHLAHGLRAIADGELIALKQAGAITMKAQRLQKALAKAYGEGATWHSRGAERPPSGGIEGVICNYYTMEAREKELKRAINDDIKLLLAEDKARPNVEF